MFLGNSFVETHKVMCKKTTYQKFACVESCSTEHKEHIHAISMVK